MTRQEASINLPDGQSRNFSSPGDDESHEQNHQSNEENNKDPGPFNLDALLKIKPIMSKTEDAKEPLLVLTDPSA